MTPLEQRLAEYDELIENPGLANKPMWVKYPHHTKCCLCKAYKHCLDCVINVWIENPGMPDKPPCKTPTMRTLEEAIKAKNPGGIQRAAIERKAELETLLEG